MGKNTSNSTKKMMVMRASGFSLVSEDIIENILSRLPALSFASASCVSKCWNKVCVRILSKPKLASALSLNPSLHVSTPIHNLLVWKVKFVSFNKKFSIVINRMR